MFPPFCASGFYKLIYFTEQMYNALAGVRRGHFGEETQEVYVWGKTCTVRESGTEARSGAVEQGGT